MRDTGRVTAGTRTVVHKLSPRFCPYLGSQTDLDCICNLANLVTKLTGALHGVGLSHMQVETQRTSLKPSLQEDSQNNLHASSPPSVLWLCRSLLIVTCVEIEEKKLMWTNIAGTWH